MGRGLVIKGGARTKNTTVALGVCTTRKTVVRGSGEYGVYPKGFFYEVKKMTKTFNLQKALKGEPLELRCGLKAYITGEDTADGLLCGYVVERDNMVVEATKWERCGREALYGDYYDIVGMWGDKPDPDPEAQAMVDRILKNRGKRGCAAHH